MRAVQAPTPGGPEALEFVELPELSPTDGHVVIDVVATAVNRADLLQRAGHYPPPPGTTETLGLECSGVIAAVGSDVTGWAVGDQVCALRSGGGYAQQVLAPVGQLLPVPRGIDLVTAASLPEVVCTVWSNIVMTAGLAAGERVLVHGGAGGIGTMAIQIAKSLGTEVVTTVGSAEKAAFCRSLGADHTIQYRDESFVEVVRALENPGIDVILDNMGAKYLADNVKALRPDGRLVVIGLQGGTRAELDLGLVLAKRLAVHGTSLRSRSYEAKARIVAAVTCDIWPAFSDETVRPVVDVVMPWAKVGEAHQRMANSQHTGKIVLTIN